MKNRKSKSRNLKLASVFLVGTVLAAGGGLWAFSGSSGKPLQLQARNFPAGTKLDYQIVANGKSLFEGQAVAGSKGDVTLSVPPSVKDTDNIAYKMQIIPPDLGEFDVSNQALNMILSLQKNEGTLNISGSNLPDSTQITVGSNTQDSKKIVADWAGLFSEKIETSVIGKKNEPLRIAFRKNDVSSGLDPSKSGVTDAAVILLSDYDPVDHADLILSLFEDGTLNNGPSMPTAAMVRQRYTRALIHMTQLLSEAMALQTTMIGMFLDAKMQMQTQRKIQELQARAHKDYHPSEQMCRIGTFMRSIAHTESRAELNKQALNRLLMNDYLGVQGNYTEGGADVAILSRISQFSAKYCDPRDNGGGLDMVCTATLNLGSLTPEAREKLNKDIDYARTVDSRLTLDVDFMEPKPAPSGDEEDVIALARNLYHVELFLNPDVDALAFDLRDHFDSRSYAAKLGVAHNSFVNIVGMKSRSPDGVAPTNGVTLAEDAGWAYMKALLREFGVDDANGDGSTDDEIEQIMGEHPSYYAQMEILTKKIYQSPNFYTNLYDKPANVARIGASLDAIALMSQRDRHESLMRSEMLAAILVEQALQPEVESTSSAIFSNVSKISVRN